MIRYRLNCACGHEFDGWFAGSGAFDTQKAAGQLACPACGGTEVAKALMAPGIPPKGRPMGKAEAPGKAADAGGGQPEESRTLAQPHPKMEALKEAMRELRKQVVAQSDYVGDRFAEEARKIHYKEAEERAIYGEATAEEARELHEDGIEAYPLPILPEDRN